MEDFRSGVTACLRSWSALRTAVDSGWGGGERQSQAKADELRQGIFGIMDGSACPLPHFEAEDLADNLAIFLEEEFSVTVEDDSEKQLADVIFQMYEACARGDSTLAQQMVIRADSAVAFNAQFQPQVQTTEHDDDDDDVDMSTDGITQPTTSPLPVLDATALIQIPEDYNSKPLFGEAKKAPVLTGPTRQLGEATFEETNVAEMDDDGFSTVKPKTRRQR